MNILTSKEANKDFIKNQINELLFAFNYLLKTDPSGLTYNRYAEGLLAVRSIAIELGINPNQHIITAPQHDGEYFNSNHSAMINSNL